MTRWRELLVDPMEAAAAAVAAARREVEREATNVTAFAGLKLRRLPCRQALAGARQRLRNARAVLEAAEARALEVERRRAGVEPEPVHDDDEPEPAWVCAIRRRRAGL